MKDQKIEEKIGPDLHLGCGGKAPQPVGKSKKVCADCHEAVEVDSTEIICPKCDGPLGD